MTGPPKDYVDVAERIRQFKAAFPDGSLQSHPDHPPKVISAGDKAYVVYCAMAYRTPDDGRPGVGWAWEPVPGPTPFTRDSELMNAETSAWGRAIVSLGFDTKHVASSNEVQNRQTFVQPSGADGSIVSTSAPEEPPKPASEKPITPGQLAQLATTLKLLNAAFPEHPGEDRTWETVAKEHVDGRSSTGLSMAEANELNDWLEGQFLEAQQAAQVPFG